MTTTNNPPTNSSPFGDLFKPLNGTPASAEKPAESASNAATGPTPQTPGAVASQNGTVSQESVFSSLKHTEISSGSISGGPGSAAPAPGTPGASVSLGGMIQGEWAVNLMDALLPAAIVIMFHAAGVKLRKSEVQLTQAEKNTIAPILQKCLDTVLLNFNNPWNALAITLVAIYGAKIGEKGLVAWLDKTQAKKEQEALEEKLHAADLAANPAKHDPANQSAYDLQMGNVQTLTDTITEEEVKAGVKRWKCSREKAIEKIKKARGLS